MARRPTIKASIAVELVEALRTLGARSDLLGIVGSYGDTMPDAWVLDELRAWNARNEKTAAP